MPHGASNSIRLFVLDDHAVVRRGLRAVLELEDDIEVVGEAGTIADAVPQILDLEPDLAILDGRLPDGDGIDACRQIRAANPQIRALILTGYDDDEALFNSILAGAAGYVLKHVGESTLVKNIRDVVQGRSLIDPAVAMRVIDKMRGGAAAATALPALTATESRILDLITQGLTNRQIGERLYLAEKTVKNHVTSLLAKLGVKGRTQAAVLASQHRTLVPPTE